jgi:hypothetical protein
MESMILISFIYFSLLHQQPKSQSKIQHKQKNEKINQNNNKKLTIKVK